MNTFRVFSTSILCALFWFGTTSPARAEIHVEFECTIPASSGFDCNQLKERFFKGKPLPFVKQGNGGNSLKVSIGRLPAVNGYTYETTVTELAPGNGSVLKFSTFLSDGLNPTSAVQEINAVIQKGVLAFARQTDEANVNATDAKLVYQDPAGPVTHPLPTGPKSDGRWIFKPNMYLSFSKSSETPATLLFQGGSSFNYSGKLNRYVASVSSLVNRQSVPVTTGNTQGLYGVTTYAASASGAMIHGLDKDNHVNFAVGTSAYTNRLSNINSNISTTVGIEYNAHPFLTTKSNSLAVGCTVGPTYSNFTRPNILDQSQFLAISQGCNIAGSLLLDKKRGNVITAKVGEAWLANAPSFVGVNANLSATIRITDRASISPSVGLYWQTKSISTASSKSTPSLAGLSPQEIAAEQTQFAAQASSASALNLNGDLMFSYTFGDGVTRSAEDQRGTANH